VSGADTCYEGEFIDVESTEDGIIYLVPYKSYYTLDAIREACIDSVTAIANTPVKISLVDQPNGYLMLYARDNRNNISNYHKIIKVGVGITENGVKSSVSIYPNPANDLLTIETANPETHTIEIHSLNGQLMYRTKGEGPTFQIDLSSFQKGLYFITVRSRDNVRTEKIIKL